MIGTLDVGMVGLRQHTVAFRMRNKLFGSFFLGDLAKATSLQYAGFFSNLPLLVLAWSSPVLSDTPVFLLAAGELFNFHLLHKNTGQSGRKKKSRYLKAGRKPTHKFVLGWGLGGWKFRLTAITPWVPKGTARGILPVHPSAQHHRTLSQVWWLLLWLAKRKGKKMGSPCWIWELPCKLPEFPALEGSGNRTGGYSQKRLQDRSDHSSMKRGGVKPLEQPG